MGSLLGNCVAWVPVPMGRVHVPVPGTRTGYLGTAMVRTLTYHEQCCRTGYFIKKKLGMFGENGTAYLDFGYGYGTASI